MLDNQDRIPQITQVKEGFQQTVVVTLVQTNGRLIKDIHNSDQTRADLRGQTNTLSLTARKRIRAAVQGQILKPDIHQKLQTVTDFLEDFFGNFAFMAIHLEIREILMGLFHRHIGAGMDGFVTDKDIPGFPS